jgi:magnesium-transporting ATPase (P-type)
MGRRWPSWLADETIHRSRKGIEMAQADNTRKVGPTSNRPRKRPWSVTAVGLLLLLQAVGLFGLGAIYFATVYLLELWAPLTALSAEELLLGVVNKVIMSVIFIPLSLLAILAAIGFLRLWHNAWTNAMLLQGLTLLIALTLYFTGKPFYVYILMLYSIFMVLYLSYHDVQMAFRPKPMVENRKEIPQGGERCGGDR